ncbi:hypothetical protein ACTL6P_00240 [Endozoicomonas acroporae]|uniref:hypothetical protein n=1 Tax=Endozoicomonas acroporae TaxID=1701104 RepID=UPI000C764FE1|nr:hypothetical protein [Endozoicomonas acroporae]
MYIGSDGRVYQNKFESLGHGTKMPGYADEQYAITQRLGELRRRQQEYNGVQQQQALTQQSIDKNDTDLFYDRQRQHDELINRQYGIGQTSGQAAVPSTPQGRQAGYGMPMERKETVASPLTQDAGKLNRMLQKYHQGQDPRDAEDAINFINQHPGIKAGNVSSIQMNHSDRNEDPLVSLLGDDGNPVKQFYLSSLSNLNNFAGQRQQTYDPGSKGASDPAKLMEQLMPMAEAMATQSLAGQNLSQDELAKLKPPAVRAALDQLMKPYQPRDPGYQNGQTQYQNDNPDFDLFGPRETEAAPKEKTYQDVIDELVGAPPPPSAVPSTPVPKRGYGHNPGSYPMRRAPGTFLDFNPVYGR